MTSLRSPLKFSLTIFSHVRSFQNHNQSLGNGTDQLKYLSIYQPGHLVAATH